MQVILLERVERLGQMGDVVKVKNGFARNFLLPRKKALRATKENIARFEKDRGQLEARNLELKTEASGVSKKVDGKSYVLIRQAGESGQLYGSVSTRDISDAVTAGGATVSRQQVLLDKPIKTIGLYQIKVQLHPEVRVTVTINVARNEDEAGRQARGENVTPTAIEEAKIAAEAMFESEDVAKAALHKDEEGAEEAPAEGEAAPKPKRVKAAKPEAAEEAEAEDAKPAKGKREKGKKKGDDKDE